VIILTDEIEIKRIVRDLVRQEQQNAQTLSILSAKVKDADISRQLQEIANREQQAADGLTQISFLVSNASAYAGTGVLNNTDTVFSGDALSHAYTDVLSNYDGSRPARAD